ncbi:adenylate/guanylate cyclase domain-containing protein [Nocardioides sp. ChNu-153]|uniref:adenylate/guanylate cyclase domain-containing protein n=1 Tax=unclassified Nocardioides TaxID=2615069 RepID=UPI0024068CF6|nr:MULTISPECIES: adenylate/guanylate cyclase domain-containing protein [unclassified Nocardioides]MDF9717999.1 adenylate/guanylate cyclase domain-containing protein [Nocardioides sp. ChNu-99]MDN7120934.1 adenylate/guanylate cyclase domain-containing protein [Nocardioides sp. ChNu-153]
MTTAPDPQPDPTGGEGGRPTRTDLERAILGEVPVFTAQDLDEAGIPVADVRRLWRALGLPLNEADVTFTGSDTTALAALVETVERGGLDMDTAVNLTRAVGQTMARLADWEISALIPVIDERESGPGATGSRIGAAVRLVEDFRDVFEQLTLNAWRRHLAAAVSRVEGLDELDEETDTAHTTVGFADLVSFTALSNQLEESRIGDLVEVFESRCHDVIQAHQGRLIKSLGDSVLFVNDDPVRALEIAEGIITVIGRDARMPDVRVGMATGHVVTRLGDVFGPPVNLASRLTNIARRNRMIIDHETARLLPRSDFETRLLPARPVRGFGLLEPVTVRRT